MKVRLKYGQLAYQGKLDDLIYYWHPIAGRMIARRRPRDMAKTAQNERIGMITRNLKALNPSAEYREDARVYLALSRQSKDPERFMNWVSLFNAVMWRMQKDYPEIDIRTLTRADIFEADLPCISIRKAVDAGYLREVSGYERLGNPM